MMREEFEKMIGLEITQQEYESIEAYYMSLPGSVDKQKFAKTWLKDGGIQILFDKRAENYGLLKLRLQDIVEENQRLDDRNNELAGKVLEQKDRIKVLEEKLATISALTKELLG
jgi:hypothetical protein